LNIFVYFGEKNYLWLSTSFNQNYMLLNTYQGFQYEIQTHTNMTKYNIIIDLLSGEHQTVYSDNGLVCDIIIPWNFNQNRNMPRETRSYKPEIARLLGAFNARIISITSNNNVDHFLI